MTKSTITREQLEEWVAQFDEDGGCDATDRQLETLIRQSLAAMESEPVAWREPFTGRCVSSIFYQDGSSPIDHGYEPLYSAPQEPVAEVLSNLPGNDTSTIDRTLPVGTQLYRHAQPAPVVLKISDEMTSEQAYEIGDYHGDPVDVFVRGANWMRQHIIDSTLSASPQEFKP